MAYVTFWPATTTIIIITVITSLLGGADDDAARVFYDFIFRPQRPRRHIIIYYSLILFSLSSADCGCVITRSRCAACPGLRSHRTTKNHIGNEV